MEEWSFPATLPEATLLRGCFSCFLNCTNGIKLRQASHMFTFSFIQLSHTFIIIALIVESTLKLKETPVVRSLGMQSLNWKALPNLVLFLNATDSLQQECKKCKDIARISFVSILNQGMEGVGQKGIFFNCYSSLCNYVNAIHEIFMKSLG